MSPCTSPRCLLCCNKPVSQTFFERKHWSITYIKKEGSCQAKTLPSSRKLFLPHWNAVNEHLLWTYCELRAISYESVGIDYIEHNSCPVCYMILYQTASDTVTMTSKTSSLPSMKGDFGEGHLFKTLLSLLLISEMSQLRNLFHCLFRRGSCYG